jgi:malate synthase
MKSVRDDNTDIERASESIALRLPAGRIPEATLSIVTSDALHFVGDLEREFRDQRARLMCARQDRQAQFSKGEPLQFLPRTADIRDTEWKVIAPAHDLVRRRVEIHGPPDTETMINGLNSGADVFIADFEDCMSPLFGQLLEGHANLVAAIERRIAFTDAENSEHVLVDNPAILMVRPRGLHLTEKHFLVDDARVSASLFDFGLYMFNCAQLLLDHGSGPYFYLPKIESYAEARLWNEVFLSAENALGISNGSIRATALIETITAAFEMEEILYELRDHSAGLNAGRCDYVFSIIKTFRDRGADYVLPDWNSVHMNVPFMRAYSDLLVRTCHRRGAHAIGGMDGFVPSPLDAVADELALAKVVEDKGREARDGYDGAWVAHPMLVEACRGEFEKVLRDRGNQIGQLREDVVVGSVDLLSIAETPGDVTEDGLRNSVSVGIQYLESWLRGAGAVTIFNLLEDTASAEIARSQIWQWIHNHVSLKSGREVDRTMVRQLIDEEVAKLRNPLHYARARGLFEQVALSGDFVEFLTLPAYELLP